MNKLIAYLKQAREELGKVTWPTKHQTLNYSLAVIGLSIVLAVFIGAVDYGFNRGIEYALSKRAPSAPAADDFQVTPTGTEPITSPTINVTPGSVEAVPVTDSNQ